MQKRIYIILRRICANKLLIGLENSRDRSFKSKTRPQVPRPRPQNSERSQGLHLCAGVRPDVGTCEIKFRGRVQPLTARIFRMWFHHKLFRSYCRKSAIFSFVILQNGAAHIELSTTMVKSGVLSIICHFVFGSH